MVRLFFTLIKILQNQKKSTINLITNQQSQVIH